MLDGIEQSATHHQGNSDTGNQPSFIYLSTEVSRDSCVPMLHKSSELIHERIETN